MIMVVGIRRKASIEAMPIQPCFFARKFLPSEFLSDGLRDRMWNPARRGWEGYQIFFLKPSARSGNGFCLQSFRRNGNCECRQNLFQNCCSLTRGNGECLGHFIQQAYVDLKMPYVTNINLDWIVLRPQGLIV